MENHDIIYKCKYCRRNTSHMIIGKTEYQGINGIRVKCYVCGYYKFMYRTPNGKFVIDQEKVPERKMILPFDKEWNMFEINSEEEELANKEIDEWLKHPVGYFKGRKF